MVKFVNFDCINKFVTIIIVVLVAAGIVGAVAFFIMIKRRNTIIVPEFDEDGAVIIDDDDDDVWVDNTITIEDGFRGGMKASDINPPKIEDDMRTVYLDDLDKE